jgi:hypothetical protein
MVAPARKNPPSLSHHDFPTIMKRAIFLSLIWLSLGMASPLLADRAKDIIGEVTVTLIHATNETNVAGMEKFKALDQATQQKIVKDPRLKFASYRQMGSDKKPLYRALENWAQPMSSTDEILVRFEAQARPSKELTRLDLEFWISHKKILKTGAALSENSPMYVLGPEWRQGRMILIVSLTPYAKPILAENP